MHAICKLCICLRIFNASYVVIHHGLCSLCVAYAKNISNKKAKYF